MPVDNHVRLVIHTNIIEGINEAFVWHKAFQRIDFFDLQSLRFIVDVGRGVKL